MTRFTEHYYSVVFPEASGVTTDKKIGSDTKYEKSSVQFEVPNQIADMIKSYAEQLPEQIIAEDGIETESHCTVLYGVLSNNFSDVQNVLQGNSLLHNTRPFKVTLGDISFFEGDENDVMKIDVISQDLLDLNKKLRDNLEYSNDYDNYIPHITIAYLKSGSAKKLDDNMKVFDGMDFMVDELTFHTADDKKTRLPLFW